MTSGRRQLPVLLLALGAALPIVSGCGSSGPTNEDQITALVKDEGTNPASLCGHLTDELLARFGGRSNCLRQAAASVRDPSTHASAVKVTGSTATAVVSDRTGTRTVRLVRQQGTWKISGVQ